MKSARENIIKQIVLWAFILSLFLPFFQAQFHFVKEKPLGGYFDTEPFPVFSDSLFKEGLFQEKFERATTDNIGFHDFFVRVQCQLNYSLFNISKIQSIIIGKENYLFQQGYVDAYTGADFVGKENIDVIIKKAALVSKILKSKKISLVFAFAPGKGSYFSEYIPNHLLTNKNQEFTNYGYYKMACLKSGIDVIDLRKYFLSIKDTIQYPLFSQIGVHWSDYGSVLAIDTISGYISQLKNIKMNEFTVTNFEMRDTIKRGDQDAAILMNVSSPLPHFNLPYLNLKYQTHSSNIKPNLLTIGDSYFSCIVATGIVDSLYSDWDYWQYRNRASSDNNKPFNLKYEIEKRDVILVLATDATLNTFPYDFIDEAYELYAPKDKDYYELKDKEFRLFVYQAFDNIKKNKVWRNQLLKAAKEKGISETEQFFEAAVWCFNNK